MAKEQRLRRTLQRIYHEAAQAMEGVIDTSNMYIALYDPMTETIEFPLYFEHGQEIPDEVKRNGHPAASRKLGERKGLTDWVIREKEPLLIEKDFENETGRRGIEAFTIKTKCWLGAPMLLRGEVIGVIGLQNFEQEGVFDANHRNLLTTLASQAAIAIDNVRALRLAEEAAITKTLADERRKRLMHLQQISDQMAKVVVEPDSVLELIVQAANEVIHSDLATVYLYDENTGRFTGGVRLTQGGAPIEVEDLPKSDDIEVIEIADKQEPIYEPNANTDFTTRHSIRAYAGIPLTVRDSQGLANTVGVLFVNFRKDHNFTVEEREILEHLANQAAIAIAYTAARTSAEANEQLAALGSAAATLQHRLGNTISITLPAVLRLRYRIGDDPVAEEILDTIERNTLFANEVIRRMQTPLQSESFIFTNINSLMSMAIIHCVENGGRFPQVELTSNLTSSQRNRTSEIEALPQIRVEARLAKDMPETYASVGRLQEVFRVLVENAIKAIYPHSGQVIVECNLRTGGRRRVVEITVTDNGKGIEDKIKEKLFLQPVPRKEFGEGAGLGLWISNIVVRSHQGSINLQWTKVGEGSTFIVRLPILDHPPVIIQSKEADL